MPPRAKKARTEKALEAQIEKLDPKTMPRHVAIILDGNGRWAAARGLSRSEGHRAGGEALDRLIDFFVRLGIPEISMYAFSTENWKRPAAEVRAIWNLMEEFFDKRLEHILEKDIRIVASGNLQKLPARSRKRIESVIERTRQGRALTANFCVNYGSQDEILHAATEVVRRRVEVARTGKLRKATQPVSKKEFEKLLYTHPLAPVDLLVRPGGERRVSNFLLWQIAYAEIYYTETYWPDFDRHELVDALHWFQGRQRRFGGL